MLLKLCICLSLVALMAGPARAQTELRILVVDSITGQPVAGALVELSDTAGRSVWRGYADENGTTSVRQRPGTLTVLSMMLGYHARGPVTFTVPDQDRVRLRIVLAPAPVQVDAVAVDVRRRAWPRAGDRWGFEWRRERRPVGAFLERGDGSLEDAPSVSAVLRQFTGVYLQYMTYADPVVYMRAGSWLNRNGSITPCGPTIVVDGMVMHEGGLNAAAPIDQFVRIDQVRAMEVYRSSAEVPPEFKFRPGVCGAIVVWTY